MAKEAQARKPVSLLGSCKSQKEIFLEVFDSVVVRLWIPTIKKKPAHTIPPNYLANTVESREQQLTTWYRWRKNPARLGHTSGVKGALKFDTVLAGGVELKGTRAPQKIDIYSYEYYGEKVKDTADAEIRVQNVTDHGPKLNKRHEVSVFNYHVGELESGAQFDQTYANFDVVQAAFLAFVKDALDTRHCPKTQTLRRQKIHHQTRMMVQTRSGQAAIPLFLMESGPSTGSQPFPLTQLAQSNSLKTASFRSSPLGVPAGTAIQFLKSKSALSSPPEFVSVSEADVLCRSQSHVDDPFAPEQINPWDSRYSMKPANLQLMLGGSVTVSQTMFDK
ncbi:uncharacterized protein F5891DRAFT_1189314 [Suillus fuscotomentosus]|uniref:Uncharacterized protein n=1 Tax=Suillus fuscotomentosus TaxID=1912939 RepID=A0AAD4E505_9AGAM|nr:uncharacterized protein F5891DRAFT_1189314 [Suillus fuscotomentosus]KAG1899844.1 hypothetical protein F5891DRAFT_1189314 [Suillus fuscotomentosus]